MKFVVENDSFLRLIQVVLDPTAPKERFDAFAHFCKHDTPDFRGWCDKIRAQVQNIHSAEVHLVDNQAELLASVSSATVVVVEAALEPSPTVSLTVPDAGPSARPRVFRVWAASVAVAPVASTTPSSFTSQR